MKTTKGSGVRLTLTKDEVKVYRPFTQKDFKIIEKIYGGSMSLVKFATLTTI